MRAIKTPRGTPQSPLAQTVAFGWRGMLKLKHVPEQLMDVTVGPLIFVLMFTFLFGGSIEGSTSEYLQYTLPGVLVMSVLLTSVHSGIALNSDLSRGVLDRFRSLPIWRPAPLAGALLGDTLRYLVAATVIVGAGTLLGFKAAGGAGGVVLAVGLVIIFAFGLSWVFTTVGLLVRSPTAVNSASFMVLFLFTFISNVFVVPETLPAGLEAFVEVNPITHVVDASRAAMAGHLAASDVAYVVVAASVLTAIFGTLTTRLYRTRT